MQRSTPEYQRLRHAQRLLWARNVLGGKCCKCGSIENLQFDHIDASTKDKYTISDLLATSSLKRIN